MIKITRAASEFINKSSKQQSAVESDTSEGLRIAVYPDKANSCFSYGFGFDKKRSEDDMFKVASIKLIIAKEQAELLQDTTIDYVQMDNGQMNLIVLNPNDPSYVPPRKNKHEKN